MTHYDLHCHSTASDGALTPQDLVKRAVAQGVEVLALTDHDGTEGIIAAQQVADELPIQLIHGVEISVTWHHKTFHIVGLNIDITNPELQAGLAALRSYRLQRAQLIAKRLEQVGIAGAFEGARHYASETMLGRLHFAQFLVDAGHAKDTKDVFKRYLVRGKPGYVPGDWVDLASAVKWITASGGQAVIAHPARYKMTRSQFRKLLTDFIVCGGVAIEVCSGNQHGDEVKHLAAVAKEFNLLASCGSDFHSPEQSWTELGRISALPSSVTPIWSLWS